MFALGHEEFVSTMHELNHAQLVLYYRRHQYPYLLPRQFCSHVDTLCAEKKSGVPYILMSSRRHRQTPLPKHDEKTRHMGLAHVAQPSYLALVLLWRSFLDSDNTLLRTLPKSFRDSPAPRSAAMMHGLCEVLASTDHPIRFDPVAGT